MRNAALLNGENKRKSKQNSNRLYISTLFLK